MKSKPSILLKVCLQRHDARMIVRLIAIILVCNMSLYAYAEPFVFTTIWTAQAEFAGYYAAKEKGFYQEVGLDVQIKHPSLTCSALNRMKNEQSDATMLSLMTAMDFISQDIPLVNIFQDSMNSSNMLISRWDNDPMKMKGQKVAVFNSNPNYQAFIMSKKEGMNYEWVYFTGGINLFLSGAVDAMMAVNYNEYFQLIQSGYKLSDECVYRFKDHDYNIQETGVYVSQKYYRNHREQCRLFAQASRKGWEWVAEHPEEALEIVMKYVHKYNAPTNRIMQKMMLQEVLQLQINQDTGQREFRVRPDMVQKACRLMMECGLLRRPVTYNELLGL